MSEHGPCQFFVPGLPVTQGSTQAFIVKGARGPRAVVTHKNPKRLRSWRLDVAAKAKATIPPLVLTQTVHERAPITLRLEFFLPAPKSRPITLKTDRQRALWAYHAKRPDLDKLIRAVLDALTGTAFADDAQVFHVTATKDYAVHPQRPGVRIALDYYQP
jgi:Holliday junction resolvase RusA-like endonuclease